VRDPFRWIAASSLIRPKNVEAVLKAFAVAREREARLILDIFGDGPDRSRLENVALELGCSESVKFRGHVRRQALFAELEKAYQNRDWFLQRIKVDPMMDPLKGDPRFEAIVKKLNFPNS